MVCGEMNKTFIRTGLALGLIFLFSGSSAIAISPQLALSFNYPIQNNFFKTDMLIFISPQYANDIDITNAIEGYIFAVKKDMNWNIKIIYLTEEINQYEKIDQILEDYYNKSNINAALMIGEDTDTALSGDCDYIEKPSIVPWFTTGGMDAYEISEQGIVSKPYKMDICVSLLYPTSILDYETKKNQIINTLNKFSKQRTFYLNNDIIVFESSEINKYSKDIYKTLDQLGNLVYIQDPNISMIEESLDDIHSMYFVHGHSNPAGTKVNEWFSAENVDNLKTPFFAADGCYVGGWWSNQTDNNILDPSIAGSWYGSKIFSNEVIQVIVCGLISQNGYSYNVSFLENSSPGLINGKNIAESLIGNTFIGDNVIVFGDPTFHFTF